MAELRDARPSPASAARRWRRAALIVGPIALGLAVLVAAVAGRKAPPQAPPSEMVRAVRVIEAAPVRVMPRVTGYGAVRPATVWNAVAQVAGRIVYRHADFRKGAILDAGIEIIRIDASDYQLAIAEIEANIRAAEARLAERKVAAGNLRALLAIERKSLGLKQAQLRRRRNLLKRGTASRESVDQEERATLAQRKIVVEIENSLRLLPTQLAVEKEQIAAHESALAAARLNLSRTHIVMPFRGRVAEAGAEVTQFVQAGATLGVVDDIKVSEIEAQFPIAQLSDFARALGDAGTARPGYVRNLKRLTGAAGIHAVVRLNAGDRVVEWRGRVVRGSDTIDPRTRTVGIIAAVDDSYGMAVPGLRPPLVKGMFVEVELRAPPVAGRMVVPRAVLRGKKLLLADADDRLEMRAVRPGSVIGDLVLIDSGLAAGDRVVVSDISPAIAGMRLKPTRDEALEAAIRADAIGKGRPR